MKVTDANGCDITETTVINNADGPELITEIKPVTCGLANGMVQLSASGGTAPYTYYLGDSESSTGEYSGLSSGDYVAKVVDANGCEALLEITIGSVTSDMSMSIIATPSTCGQSNGTISVQMTGGQSPYSYKVGDRIQSEPDFTGLGNGVYEVVVTDATGCTASGNVTIDDIDGPKLEFESIPSSCDQANGAIRFIVSGGAQPYTYHLGEMESDTGLFAGLQTGFYTAKVVDANGCENIQEVTIESVSSDLSLTINSTPASCGQNNGSVSLVVSGGQPPFSYSIDNESNSTGVFKGLQVGLHTVEVVDADGCNFQSEVEIEEQEPDFEVDFEISYRGCNEANWCGHYFGGGRKRSFLL